MVLDEKFYEQLEEKINTKENQKAEETLISWQNDFLHESARLYVGRKQKELDTELRLFRRFQKLLKKNICDTLSYQIGILCGIFMAIEFLAGMTPQYLDFEKQLEMLYRKDNERRILLYLYQNPNSQYEVISEHLGLKPNYLSRLLKNMEQLGCVVRYGVNRRSFFELTLNAQDFIRKKVVLLDNHSVKHSITEEDRRSEKQ